MSLRVYGNRSLKTLPGLETRPTPSRVREAVFDIWRDRVVGCRWLDICAGVGAMGAEALGRGAVSVVGVEQSRAACRVVEQNWRRIAREEQAIAVVRGDVRQVLPGVAKHRGDFDCIYFDPPYASDLYDPAIAQVAQLKLLAPQGQLAVEHDAKRELAAAIAGLSLHQRRTYGRTALSFYHWT